MTSDDVRFMVKEYGIEHTLGRIDIDDVEDQELRTMFRKLQNLYDDINQHLYLDTSGWFLKEEVQ